MTNFSVDRIELIGNAIAFCMYGITILFLVRQGIKYRRSLSGLGTRVSSGNFNTELSHLIGQSRPFLQMKSHGEKEENQIMEGLFGHEDKGTAKGLTHVQEPKQDPEKAKHQRGKDIFDGALVADRYKEVRKFVEMDLSKEEIFKRAGIPKGEIELILKLKEMNPGLQGKDRSDAPPLI